MSSSQSNSVSTLHVNHVEPACSIPNFHLGFSKQPLLLKLLYTSLNLPLAFVLLLHTPSAPYPNSLVSSSTSPACCKLSSLFLCKSHSKDPVVGNSYLLQKLCLPLLYARVFRLHRYTLSFGWHPGSLTECNVRSPIEQMNHFV